MTPNVRVLAAWNLALGIASSGRRRSVELVGAVLARHRVSKVLGEIEAGFARLDHFGRESDREFTSLAEGLANVVGQLSSLKVKTSALVRTLSDEDEDRALSSAFTLYRRSVDLVHSSMGLAISEEEQMENIEDRLLTDRERFLKTSMLFKSLVTLIRIESARIDTENKGIFAHVAIDVSEIVGRMSEVAENAFGRIESVVADGASGRTELTSLQAELKGRAAKSASVLRDELARVRERLVPCAEKSRAILALLEDATAATAKIATALQYQDIVRQQLEHVVVGFREILEHITDAGRPGRLKPVASLDLGYLHHSIRVQQVHLSLSRKSIEDAGSEAMTGIKDLLEMGGTLVARFAALEGEAASVFGACRMGELLQKETGGLIAIAEQGEQTNERVHWLVGQVEDFAKVFSNDISRQEFDVKLVALNAQIAAARLASANALNRLAEETSRLSDDTTKITLAMSTELNEALSGLQAVKAESLETRKSLDREKRELVVETGRVVGKLNRLNDCVQRHSSEVGREFGAVHREVMAILPALTFPSLIEECYGPAERLCRQLLECTAAYASAEDLADGTVARLDAHREHYTMRSEHDAHTSALGQGGAGAAGPGDAQGQAAPEPEPSHEPDGIELF